MALALAQASRLKPELRLADAVSQFEARLSSEQKARFSITRENARTSSPGPDDVMRLTAEIDRTLFHTSGGGRCLGPRLTNFVQAVQQFAGLGDSLVGGSQNIIACGVWAVVRFSLLAIVKYSSHLERLSTLLMAVGRSAPRYQLLAVLYPQSQKLQSHLFEYFIVVVQLCHQVLEFTQKSAIRQFAAALNDSDMQSYKSKLDTWASAIREQVELLMAQRIEDEATENSRFRAMTKSKREAGSMAKKAKIKARVLNYCSSYNHETTWKQIRKSGFVTILNQSQEYLDWRIQTKSCTLLYTGKLGSGKSVLLSNIVDDLHLQVENNKSVLTYFFCRHDISESLLAWTIFGTLARQLLHSALDLASALPIVDQPSFPDVDKIFDLLRKVLPHNLRAYFILDGLDECDTSEKDTLLRQLQKLQKLFKLLICISLRDDSSYMFISSLYRLDSVNKASIPKKNCDIDNFIKWKVASDVKSKRLVVGQPALIQEIQDTLIIQHQGMFLWAVLQLESLCFMRSDAEIRHALKDLPKDLPATYSRILAKSETLGTSYQQLILKFVAVALRPLTTQELREALSVKEYDTKWDPAQLINDIHSTLACCGSIVTVDEEDQTVHLVHHSAKQFLLGSSENSENGQFTFRRANSRLANAIITYLNYDIFENQLSSTAVAEIATGSAPSRIIQSTLGDSRVTRSIALRLAGPKRAVNPDISRSLAEMKRIFEGNNLDMFHFRTYARKYWPKHVAYISEEDQVIHGLLFNLFRKSRVDTSANNDEEHSPLRWALRSRNTTVVRLLAESGTLDLNSKIWRNKAPLSWALEVADERTIKALIENGARPDPNSNVPTWNWLLSKASAEGWDSIVKVMLELANLDLEERGDNDEPALLTATRNGFQSIVELLVDNGANIESRGEFGRTSLHYATIRSDMAVVKLLVEHNIFIDPKDVDGRTPLHYAVKKSNIAMIKLLLASRAHIDSKDRRFRTSLHYAITQSNVEVVELLLKNGANLELEDNKGQTPLHSAIAGSGPDLVALLLKSNANIDSKDNFCQTPLHYAVQKSDITVIELLLEKNAETEIKDKIGQTPLHHAAQKSDTTAIQLLLEKNANIESKDEDGRTPLYNAIWRSNIKTIKLLLKKNADIESKDKRGQTPLHYAVWSSGMAGQTPRHDTVLRVEVAVVKLLLEKGANIESKNMYGQTPLHNAAMTSDTEMVEMLLENNANVESKDIRGRTPLHLAVTIRNQATVGALVEKGASIHQQDNDGVTPLQMDVERSRKTEKQMLDKWTTIRSK